MGAYGGFLDGFERGSRLVDNFIDKRENRKRQKRLDDQSAKRFQTQDQRAGEAHAAQMQKHDLEMEDIDLDKSADLYSAVAFDQTTGQPIDVSKLSKQDFLDKRRQLEGVINRTPEFRRMMTDNPDVDQDNPLESLNFVTDQQTGQPSVMYSLRMKDGSVKPMTQGRSGEPNDNVISQSLDDFHNEMMGVLGGHGRLASMTQAHQKALVATAKTRSDRSHDFALAGQKQNNALALENVKAKNKTTTDNRIKEGTAKDFTTTDENGMDVTETRVYKAGKWTAAENKKEQAKKEEDDAFKASALEALKILSANNVKPPPKPKPVKPKPKKVSLSERAKRRSGNKAKPTAQAISRSGGRNKNTGKATEFQYSKNDPKRTRGHRKNKQPDYARLADR